MRILKKRTWGDNPGAWKDRIDWPTCLTVLAVMMIVGVILI